MNRFQMAKATLDSSTQYLSPPAPSTMPSDRWPTVCGRSACAHPWCVAARHQMELPCCACDQRIPGGRVVYVLNRHNGIVTRQMCAGCRAAQRERGQIQEER